MSSQMNKIKIFLPIIKVNVEYTISSIEKIGIFEYIILDIYNKFNKNKDFNNYTFKNFVHEVLGARVPDVFLETALEYLNNENILTIDAETNLIEYSVKIFKNKDNNLKQILEKKELYFEAQSKKEIFYYDPLNNKIINTNSKKLEKSIKKPPIIGETFKNILIKDECFSSFIQSSASSESTFYKDGARTKDIKQKAILINKSDKREVTYIEREIEFKFEFESNSAMKYTILFEDNSKYMEKYKKEFIQYLFSQQYIYKLIDNQLTLSSTIIPLKSNEIIMTDINDIEKYIKSSIYIIQDNSKKNTYEKNNEFIKYFIYNIKPKDQLEYSFHNISMNEIERTVLINNGEKNNEYINIILEDLFINISNIQFYTDILKLKYIISLDNNYDYIIKEIQNHMNKLNINVFISRLLAILKILKSNQVIYNNFQKNIYKSYAETKKYSFNELKAIFQKWKYTISEKEVKEIQKKLLNSISFKKKESNENITINDSISVKNKLYPLQQSLEIRQLTEEIAKKISNINQTEKNYNKNRIFEMTTESEVYITTLSKEVNNSSEFENFNSALYKTLYERTKKNSKTLELLPKEFKFNKACRIIGQSRHYFGGHDSSNKEYSQNKKYPREEILKILKGDKIEPTDKDYKMMQQKLLKFFISLLDELIDYQKNKYLKD